MVRCSIRQLSAAIAAAAVLLCLAASAAAETKVSAHVMTEDRLRAVLAMLVALLGVVSGGWALRFATDSGRRSARPSAIVALVAGLSGASLGGVVVGTAKGGLGTGHGLGGGIVALLLGLIAIGLGGLARMRSRVHGSR
jgi:hypothetical protein